MPENGIDQPQRDAGQDKAFHRQGLFHIVADASKRATEGCLQLSRAYIPKMYKHFFQMLKYYTK